MIDRSRKVLCVPNEEIYVICKLYWANLLIMNKSILSIKRSSFITLVAVVLSFYSSGEGMAQYHPFPVDDGMWINNHSDYYVDENFQAVITSSIDYEYCANGNDTVIDAVAYKQVDYCYSSSSSYH